MKFRFCGDADCPDWVLAEINNLSRISFVKLKLLGQVVIEGIINPPLNIDKAEKLFADSKLDADVFDLKACIACLTYIITSATRFNCDSSALHSELQQLGLPREHSTSIKRITDEQNSALSSIFRNSSLKVNPLEKVDAKFDNPTKCVVLVLTIDGVEKIVTVSPFTLNALLQDLQQVREKMLQLNEV